MFLKTNLFYLFFEAGWWWVGEIGLVCQQPFKNTHAARAYFNFLTVKYYYFFLRVRFTPRDYIFIYLLFVLLSYTGNCSRALFV